jgi:hypothetical protein
MEKKLFNNTQVAFALKSDTELDRAYFLLKWFHTNLKDWSRSY